HFGPDRARVVVLLYVAVALEQVDDREIGRRLAVRYGGALEHQPLRRMMGVDELIDQARLPHPRLTDDGDHLTMTRLCTSQSLDQRRQLQIPSDKAGQPPGYRRLQAPLESTRTDQLKDIERPCDALHRHRVEWHDLHVALRQTQRRLGQQNRPRHGHLLHACRQVCRLPHRSVVHVEVAADGPYHDLAAIQPDPDLYRDATSPLDL